MQAFDMLIYDGSSLLDEWSDILQVRNVYTISLVACIFIPNFSHCLRTYMFILVELCSPIIH